MAGWQILVVALAGILLVVAGYRLAGWRTSGRARARARGGLRGEAAAVRLLERAGYEVTARSAAREGVLLVDGEPRPYGVRADLLARCPRGRLCVVEVKTGALAPDPGHGPTRRQLLEYALIFDTEHVLLVDMETARIHEIAFPRSR